MTRRLLSISLLGAIFLWGIGPALADPRRNLDVALSMIGQLDKLN